MAKNYAKGKVREWYIEKYPSDNLGNEIYDELTWANILEDMRVGENIYDILGVRDSVVRERVFEKLSEMMEVPYDVLYYLWVYGDRIFQNFDKREYFKEKDVIYIED